MQDRPQNRPRPQNPADDSIDWNTIEDYHQAIKAIEAWKSTSTPLLLQYRPRTNTLGDYM